ncbi:MAG TPA: cytochrome c1 [Gammaproteobacteria bacterium]|nr:cytochrome c1 [Gammaproteobacteria bacterium]
MRAVIVSVLLALCLPAGAAVASESGPALSPGISINLSDTMALQRGARDFFNSCSGCHSLQYVRYSQLQTDLGLTAKEVETNFIFTGKKIGDQVTVAMPEARAAKWFGIAPPDLTDVARVRGADWLYRYLTGFYLDSSRPSGVDNIAFPKVAMPDVVWQMQGWQAPVYSQVRNADGTLEKVITGLQQVQPGTMTPAQFHSWVQDVVTFLVYTSYPHKLESDHLGVWITLLLVLFTILAYLLKKAYWEDVHHPAA